MTLETLTPVTQRTLGAEAADRLRTAIRSGALQPGARLVERDLAERLGMSRIPLREGIQRLIEEGLVQKVPHRGTFVYLPTLAEIEEIASLRVILECYVAELAIAHWSPEHEARLERLLQAMSEAAAQCDNVLLADLDTQFHEALGQIAGHSLLIEIASGLRSRISRFLFEANSGRNDAAANLADVYGHRLLVQTLKEGNVEQAKEEVTRHILGAKEHILRSCTQIGAGKPGNSATETEHIAEAQRA
jgi:DNA-binding GntR family transcriptional regulator